MAAAAAAGCACHCSWSPVRIGSMLLRRNALPMQGNLQRRAFRGTPMSLAKNVALGKKGAAPPKKKVVEVARSFTAPLPINITKDGGDIEVKPDAEYPEWVFTLLESRPTLSDYRKMPMDYWKRMEDGDKEVFAAAKRFERLHRKWQMKEHNRTANDL